MDIPSFLLHAGAAALMGVAIGLERQWRPHTAGLRTNTLVAFGACLFVSLPRLLGGTPTAAHIAGQVVTGVGFLGVGVILREGANVRGMNTAATLWCSAAVGALTGAGLVLEGLAGTVGVVGLNLCLRPVSEWLDRRSVRATNLPTHYRLKATCKAGHEADVRAVLLKFFHDHPTMTVQGLASQDGGGPDRSCVTAEIYADRRDDCAIEDLMGLVDNEPSVTAVSWDRAPIM
jgi:putative Mg2+ transporter-C (MgtC) family protein